MIPSIITVKHPIITSRFPRKEVYVRTFIVLKKLKPNIIGIIIHGVLLVVKIMYPSLDHPRITSGNVPAMKSTYAAQTPKEVNKIPMDIIKCAKLYLLPLKKKAASGNATAPISG